MPPGLFLELQRFPIDQSIRFRMLRQMDKLAIGLGPTRDPLHIYQVTPSSVSEEPMPQFSAEYTSPTLSNPHPGESISSVYACCSTFAFINSWGLSGKSIPKWMV